MNELFTLIDAEKAFKAYGCTHFHMSRDEPELYSKYRNLNISKECEWQWTKESFVELCKQQSNNLSPDKDLWWQNSRATELAEYLHNKEILSTLYESSLKILDRVPPKDAIMCAESILDRREVSAKRGVIFLSLKFGEVNLANQFLELAVNFLKKYDNSDQKRKEGAVQRAKVIKPMLGK